MKPLIVVWSFYVSWRKRTNLAFIISFVVLVTRPRWFSSNPVYWGKDITKNIFLWSIVLKILYHWGCRHEFHTGFWVLKCSDLIIAMTSKCELCHTITHSQGLWSVVQISVIDFRQEVKSNRKGWPNIYNQKKSYIFISPCVHISAYNVHCVVNYSFFYSDILRTQTLGAEGLILT